MLGSMLASPRSAFSGVSALWSTACLCRRWATKKAGGSASKNRDSAGRRLGLKRAGGQAAFPGQILLRQRGTKVLPGFGVGMGRDHTLFAMRTGQVSFEHKGDRSWLYLKHYPAANKPRAVLKREEIMNYKAARRVARKQARTDRAELLQRLQARALEFKQQSTI